MNLFTRLARNSLWILSARVGAQASMVIVTYLLARRLGTAGFGEYAFIATAIVIGNTLTTFGSDMYLIREIAAKSELSELSPVLFLQLLLSFLFIGFVYLLARYLPNQTPETVLALKVYSFALIPLAFFTVFTSALRGAQKMTAYAWLNLVIPVIQALAIFIFIQHGTNIVTLAYLLLLIQIAGAILGGIFCSANFPRFWIGIRFSLDKLLTLFVACLPIALIAISGIVYQKMSIAMLSFLSTASGVGLFSAAARVVEAARIGHFAVFTALYPAMANTDHDQSSKGTFRFSWYLLLTISAIGSILIFLLAKPVVDIFFGAEYQAAIPVLKVLAFTLLPYTVNSFLSLVFLARKKEKVVLHVFIVSLLMLLTLNLWFIPRAGQMGASWAILVAEITQAILFLLAWLNSPFRQIDTVPSKGVSYELSDLS
ncbi:MAG: flippase [Chloroflexota bacterium]